MSRTEKNKSPLETARLLASVYGHRLDRPVVYTQGVAISGRLRLHNLLPPAGSAPPDITKIVEPYVSAPGDVFTPADGTANYAGVCWAGELAEATGDRRHARLLTAAADMFTDDPGGGAFGSPLDPDVRVEDFFFAATVLGKAFELTGEERYIRILSRFLMACDTQQPDGLWWHSKASPYFWGRGNAFAALGFAETLTYLPEGHLDRHTLTTRHIRHLEALRQHQDKSGMWRQVVDRPDSYIEHSATSMIGYSIARGIRRGWLDSTWRPALDLAWDGVTQRIGNSGELEHVCGGTGPQPDLQSYLDRPFSDGRDERGGAMALWFAVEMARLEQGV